MVEQKLHTSESVRELLSAINDPEVPVINILELGIVREVRLFNNEVTVNITPTYSGCPAMRMIEDDIHRLLKENGFSKVSVKTILAPAWTTDWMSEAAKAKLKKYGIAPPESVVQSPLLQIDIPTVQCPNCNSKNTQVKSQFGSTACKSYYFCQSCQQAFEYFKPL